MLAAAPRLWGEMTAPQLGAAAEAGDLVLLPIGAVEQHGAHLPVDTDIRLGIAVAEEVSRRFPAAIVAPPVWWGLSGYHTDFPGYFTLSTATFMALVKELCANLVDQGFRKVALVVGHGSNKPVVGVVVSEVMRELGVAIVQLNYLNLGAAAFRSARVSGPGGEFHAGELETALMLHHRPDLVDMERTVTRYVDPVEHLGLSAGVRDIFAGGDATIGIELARGFPVGVAGDARGATPELGAQVFAAIVERTLEILREYHGGRAVG